MFPESSQAVKSGGCFPGNAKVKTKSGEKLLSSLQIGDEVKVIDPRTGELRFSEVILFLDKNPDHIKNFMKIDTSSGKTLQVTPSHLIVAIKKSDVLRTEESASGNTDHLQTMFASQIEIGDTVLIIDGDRKLIDEVVNVTNTRQSGVYAPLTTEGTIVVNDVVTSCYAVIKSHYLAHLVYGPLRLYHNFQLSFRRLWESILKPLLIFTSHSNYRKNESVGIHWYANVLFSIAEYILPPTMMYGS